MSFSLSGFWCEASPGTYHREREIASVSLLPAGSTCGHKLQYWYTNIHSPRQDCSYMYLYDSFWQRKSHQSGKKERGRWGERAGDFIAWAVQIPVAQFSAGVLLLEGVSEVIYHKYKAFSKVWIQFFIKSALWMTILYLPYRSKEKFNWWLLTSMTVYTFCLFILKSMLNVTVPCFHKANAATYSHPVSFAWRIAKPELQLMIE